MGSLGSRVLMLLENNPYQFDRRPKAEARTLVKAGYQVTVVCPRPKGGKWHEVREGVHLYQFPQAPERDGLLSFLWEYTYSAAAMFVLSLVVLFRRGFDVVHAHNPPDIFFPIGAFYKLLGKRFVFDHHDLAPEMYRARFRDGGQRLVYQALVWSEQATCRVADHVIATNESYKRVEMERGGVPEERITVVRNGPGLDGKQPVPPDPVLRQKAGAIFGYVGRMGPQDGVDYLLRALYHLVYDLNRRDIYCVIVGTGDVLPELKALTKELGLEPYVWFTGWISDADLVRTLCTADICVDPDPSNPFTDRSTMLKMMDYMALGKPIVAFDLPEHRVTAEEAAVYAQPNDEMAFARALASLMDDPARREAMGRFGRARVQACLAWAHQEKNLLASYDILRMSPAQASAYWQQKQDSSKNGRSA